MRDWREDKRFFWATMLLPTAWFLLFFVVPMAMVWAYSVGENVGPVDVAIIGTFANYAKAFSPEVIKVMWDSIWLSLLTTLICLVLGFPVALAMTFADQKQKTWLLLLIMLPFWTNLLIRTYALIAVMRTSGVINTCLAGVHTLLVHTGLPLAPFEPLPLLYNKFAVVVGLVYVHLPFMVLPLYAALDRLDKSLIEASLDLGASHIETIRRIIAPLAAPGIAAGLVITFIPALGAYLTPDLLGGPDDLMIASLIERQFKRANDWPFGAALSFILMYITLLFFAIRAFMGRTGGKVGVH
ncbi:ABC transporter permease [Candidatus Phycosocius spiralis]|nr:ABC transporter permease [Candidatus Phycosocius spiralis]